jgi:hypothetical protein
MPLAQTQQREPRPFEQKRNNAVQPKVRKRTGLLHPP